MTTLDDYSERVNFPYMQGLYLATNALRDAYLLVDGPNCTFHKAEHVFGSHDVFSSLLDVGGRHRIAHTDLNVDSVITSHEGQLVALLRAMASSPEPGAVILAALPMAALTGMPYREVAEKVGQETGRRIHVLPDKSLQLDWLDGYADYLACLARDLDWGEPEPGPERVGIVGYFMDRNEGDHTGNLAELRRLVEGLGLEVTSIWLSGQTVADLRAIRRSGHIVSLPHAREAARVVAERLGVGLVVVDEPFGLDATGEFVRRVGRATGRAEAAEGLVRQHLARIAPMWEWLIPRRLTHRNVAYFGDPLLIPGLRQLAALMGFQADRAVACSRRRPLLTADEGVDEDADERSRDVAWEPRTAELSGLLSGGRGAVDLYISNFWGIRWAGGCDRGKTLEFGFPSRGYHCCRNEPFLGYEGVLAFVDRMSNALGDRGVNM